MENSLSSDIEVSSDEIREESDTVKGADDNESPRRNGLFSITENLKYHRSHGDTSSTTEPFEATPLIHSSSKPIRRKRMDRSMSNNGLLSAQLPVPEYIPHNNNHLKNERLSPGTTDTSSRSITPSSASHPDTPPAQESSMLAGRNYSDIMRSLAAKYNNTNPNDYFNAARNGFPPPIDPRFKPNFPSLLPINSQNKENDVTNKRTDFPVLNPFSSITGPSMYPGLIDMSTTQALMAMVQTAKEVELQSLLKNVKRPETSPLDLSAGALPPKRSRTKTPSASSPPIPQITTSKRAESESPKLHEDISSWSVDDVCNFISGIDICAEYSETFRNERIDGAGLPLLTEEHLTNVMNMKLGPALKLRSILAKKLGSCNICLHCSHCHNSSGSLDAGNNAGNSSDSGGVS